MCRVNSRTGKARPEEVTTLPDSIAYPCGERSER